MAERSSWADFEIVLLARVHDRTTFSCGKAPLDEYLKKHSRQNDDKGLTKTFVLLERSSTVVSGYYTVRYGQVNFEQLPEAERKGLPRYSVPTFHIARLAVDEKYRGQGKRLGEFLLTDALRRALAAAEQAGLYAIEVVAKDGDASAFYAKYQFRGLIDDTLHMYLPIALVRKTFAS
ncbi:MAG: GNAT family N-acetyltransferase [Deltaproteobacteria bacterium]|nr:GNAT family N-acetyltransferase [Deltaproteobacteria bacterium]